MIKKLTSISPMKKMDKMSCCVLCVILGFVVGMLYAKSSKEGMKNKTKKHKNSIVYCHMKGCPHCEKVMPEWDSFHKKHDGVYNKVKMVKIENKENPEFMNKHNVKGFPTFIYVDKNGKGKEVDGRTENDWKKFLDNV